MIALRRAELGHQRGIKTDQKVVFEEGLGLGMASFCRAGVPFEGDSEHENGYITKLIKQKMGKTVDEVFLLPKSLVLWPNLLTVADVNWHLSSSRCAVHESK